MRFKERITHYYFSSVMVLFVLFSAGSLQAQQEITGVVTSESGDPLIGASILIKGSSTGTVTDLDGSFSLEADSDDVLVFSYTGFAPKEITVGSQTEIMVSLKEDVALLEQVVVTGYGSTKKENLTGSVGVVSSKSIEARPITDASQALAGQVSGVWVNQNSGEPGQDGANINIRGIGTLNNASPLILVDGIEAPIGNIDPNDIESITVLKDAASAAIYGSRAANGVVLVTTKRGSRNSKPTFNYTGFGGVSQVALIPDYIFDSQEFMELRNEADINSGNQPLYPQNVVNQFADGPNTNWFDELLQRGGIQQHNLSISGGSENTNFNISLGYLQNEGVVRNVEGSERYNIRLNLDTEVNEQLTIGASVFASRQVSQLDNVGQDGGFLARATRLGPNFPAFDELGRLADRDRTIDAIELSTPNILAEVQALTRTLNDDRFLGNIYAEYEVIDGLKVKGTFAANYQVNDDIFFDKSIQTFDWRTGDPGLTWLENRRFENSYSQSLALTSWLQATYEKRIGRGELKLLAGANQESFINRFFSASRLQIPSNSLPALSTGNPETAFNNGGAQDWALRSFFGRVNYVLDEKYLFEFNVRRDGSSRFGANNRWATFPSISAGWVVSREPWLANNKVIDFLKVRASWGQLGNQLIGNYPFAANISFDPAYSFGGTIVGAAAQTSLGNPDIRWETTTQADIGINIALFGKLSIEADYFIRDATDILFNQNNAGVTGVRQPTTVNIAEVRNQGWELSANYTENIGDFNFTIGGNVTNVDNEVLQIDPNLAGGADRVFQDPFILQRGSPINAIYGLEVAGIFQSQAEIDGAPDQSGFGQPTPGDLRYVDENGDGVITIDDRKVLGQDNPRWLYGINGNFEYKGFDMSFIIQGIADAQVTETGRFFAPFANSGGVAALWRDRWTPENPDATLPKIRIGTGGINYNVTHSRWVTDRDFLRLKNLQFGYTLPSDVFANNFIESLRIYVNGTNLFTITDYVGFDPERGQRSTNGTAGYPQLKVFTGGVNLRF
ncbi:MAG TPA: TonB-dependent receptor [Saprospiraceae bacterium]|nr:TonB-dependent receptor [Saprospiraceae bacterium]